MIIRKINEHEAWCITQLHHSRMTGEIARLWGNSSFRIPEFAEALRTAALLHDVGWTSWELHPEIDPQTGHPYDFLKMKQPDHVKIWEAGLSNSIGFGMLPALLVYRHNIGLASLKDDNDPMMTQFFKQASEKESMLFEEISQHIEYSLSELTEKVATLNSYLLFWDYISLRMCMGKEKNPFGEPPSPLNTDFKMDPHPTETETFTLEPWPFGVKKIQWNAQVYKHRKGETFSYSSPVITLPLTLISS